MSEFTDKDRMTSESSKALNKRANIQGRFKEIDKTVSDANKVVDFLFVQIKIEEKSKLVKRTKKGIKALIKFFIKESISFLGNLSKVNHVELLILDIEIKIKESLLLMNSINNQLEKSLRKVTNREITAYFLDKEFAKNTIFLSEIKLSLSSLIDDCNQLLESIKKLELFKEKLQSENSIYGRRLSNSISLLMLSSREYKRLCKSLENKLNAINDFEEQ